MRRPIAPENICQSLARRIPESHMSTTAQHWCAAQLQRGAGAGARQVLQVVIRPTIFASRNCWSDAWRAREARSDAVLAYPRTRLFDDEAGTARDYDDNMDLQADDPVERYAQCGERLDLNNVINGVIRTQATEGHDAQLGLSLFRRATDAGS